MAGRRTLRTRGGFALFALAASWLAAAGVARGQGASSRVEMGVAETIRESLFGDAYDLENWRPLSLSTFASEGWLEPWAAGPAGREGLTPRHGWLGSFSGVFYRLWLSPFTYQNDLRKASGGDGYTGDYAIFLPLSRRFELLIDAPFLVSNGTKRPGQGYRHDFGDLVVTPRFLLQEDEATTQSFTLDVRTPTGDRATSGGTMALTPRYEFWTNPVGPWVARGSASFFVPLNVHDTPFAPANRPGPLGEARSASQTSFVGGLAVGRYFRPHDVPFGDLVFYASSNLIVPLDGHSDRTYVGAGAGTRFHIARDYYFLHYWEAPVTGSKPYDYSAQFAIVKIF